MMKLLLFLLFPALICAQTSFQQAEEYFNNEQFNKAKPLFKEYLKQNPNHVKN